jgi:RNA polymerase sigma factor (TIGR02999 family)
MHCITVWERMIERTGHREFAVPGSGQRVARMKNRQDSNGRGAADPSNGASDGSTDKLIAQVYDELRRVAAHVLRSERRGHTLQPTALVHEAYLQLARSSTRTWDSHDQFTAVASAVIRRVLVQHARRRNQLKREGRWTRLRLDTSGPSSLREPAELLALNDALSRLGALDPQKERIAELRCFGGLTMEEIARLLDTSPRTIERHWRLARAWLQVQLVDGE